MSEGERDADDLLDLGTRRHEVLSRIAGAPASKPMLVEALDVSRSTVNRALRDLGEWHLVDRTDEGYVATASGRLLADALDRCLDDLATLADACRLLAHLPPGVEVPLELLRDAAVYPATPPSPTSTLDRVRDGVKRADRCRCLIGALADKYAAEFFRRRIAGGMDFEAVLADHILSYLLAERREVLRTYVADGGVRSVEDIPYSLVIAEGEDHATCYFVVYDDGDFAGLLVNDTADAVEWATATFERYRDRATPLDP